MFTALAMILVAPFQWWGRRRQRLRLLPPEERLLRQASRPVAWCVVLLTVALVLYGWRAVVFQAGRVVGDARETWQLLLVAAFIVVGVSISVLSAARQCVALRDPMQTFGGFTRLVFGAPAAVFLAWAYPWNVPSVWAFFGCAAVFLLAEFCAVTGAIRFTLLLLQQRSARDAVQADIDAHMVDWECL